MSRLMIVVILFSLAAVGCNESKHSQDQVTLDHKGIALQPVVTIVPVIDSTKNELPWSLSEELTAAIGHHLSHQGELNIVTPSKSHASLKRIKEGQNPFSTDIGWIKNAFTHEDFVVFLELVEHEEVLRNDKKKPVDPQYCSADLNMSMRLRIVDVRSDQPKVVLQELLHDSHFVPRQFTHVNFHQAPWGKEIFSISPMGLAHAAFTKEITARIEDYILLSSHK